MGVIAYYIHKFQEKVQICAEIFIPKSEASPSPSSGVKPESFGGGDHCKVWMLNLFQDKFLDFLKVLSGINVLQKCDI